MLTQIHIRMCSCKHKVTNPTRTSQMAPESLPSPRARVPSATGNISGCLPFCGKSSNFDLPVSCWMLFDSLIFRVSIMGGRGQSSPFPKTFRGGWGVLLFTSVRPDVLRVRKPKHSALPRGKFSSWRNECDVKECDSLRKRKPGSRRAITKWNPYLAWVICTSIVVEENLQDSSAFVFNF